MTHDHDELDENTMVRQLEAIFAVEEIAAIMTALINGIIWVNSDLNLSDPMVARLQQNQFSSLRKVLCGVPEHLRREARDGLKAVGLDLETHAVHSVPKGVTLQ